MTDSNTPDIYETSERFKEVRELRRSLEIHWNNLELFHKRKANPAYNKEEYQEELSNAIQQTKTEITRLIIRIEKWPF